jgi:hypothetical protein
MKPSNSQPWLHSAAVDLLFILLPPFMCLGAIMAFPDFFHADEEMPVAAWVVLVLLIDVGHVYSTLFRTYLDKETFRQQKQLMVLVPLAAWVAGMLLYSVSALFFWRVLAYLAGNRLFSWFISGDFLAVPYPQLLPVLTAAYIAVIGVYLVKETWVTLRTRVFNFPRNLVIVGTLLSWYQGIVYYNGDLIYTTFNVVSHGIPYLALVWIYGRKEQVRAARQGAAGGRLGGGGVPQCRCRFIPGSGGGPGVCGGGLLGWLHLEGLPRRQPASSIINLLNTSILAIEWKGMATISIYRL